MDSLLLKTYIKDSDEKHRLFHMIDIIPCVAKKAQWALRWIGGSEFSRSESTQLDSNEQQKVIGKIVNVTADSDKTNDEDVILGRFSQLSRDYTDYVHKLLVPCMEEHKKKRKDEQKIAKEETSSDWQSHFAEFYFGFSVVWFKGQSMNSQRWLIEHPNSGRSVKALPFGIQALLIDTVEKELREQTCLPHGNLRISVDATNEIISHILTFGFRLLSATDQQLKIEEISGEASGKVEIIKRLAEESEEDFRMRTFTSQVHKVRQLGSNGRKNMIDQFFDWLMETYYSSKYTKDVIVEKLSGGSEEDFRLRRFIKLCTTHPSLWDQNEVAKWDLTSTLQTSRNQEREKIKHDSISVSRNNFSSRYAEFYFGLSIIWFKTVCTNEPRNPIQVLLGEAEEGDIIEKLCGENEEDFRLRRFIKSFKQLQLSSQEYIVEYIRKTLRENMVYCYKWDQTAKDAFTSTYWFEEDLPFAHSSLHKVENSKSKGRRRGRSNWSRRWSNRNYTRKTGRDRTEWDEMGRDKMRRNGEGAKMPSDGNKEEEEGDGEVIILCSTDVERVVPGGEVE
ncbi:hypothetical protein DVH24_026445 [Malus domestica]|uniref:Uncharacterized protein n=1 Tax=Malus domestica TaxID=3750 RepID=A0A498KGK3_MALDO|nr:hypothetical protein DVH24_026445 [Malus domestica]